MNTLTCVLLVMLAVVFLLSGFIGRRLLKKLELEKERSNNIRKEGDVQYYHHLDAMTKDYQQYNDMVLQYIETMEQLASLGMSLDIAGLLQDMRTDLEAYSRTEFCAEHPLMNAILMEKKEKAKKSDVTFDVYVEPPFNPAGISEGDLTVLLGRMLDHAINAASRCAEDRLVMVRFFLQNESTFSVLKVLYTDERGINSKGRRKKKYGRGLDVIQETAEKCGGFLELIPQENKIAAVIVLPR